MTPHDSTATVPAEVGDEPAGRPIPTHPDALLLPIEVAFLFGLRVRSLEIQRWKGEGPPFVSLSRRCVRYRRRDIVEFIETRVRKSTSDPGQDSEAPASLAGD